MNIQIYHAKDLHLINHLFDSQYKYKLKCIEEFLYKESYKYVTNDYKPGSKQWQELEDVILKVNAIPNHPIEYVGDVEFHFLGEYYNRHYRIYCYNRTVQVEDFEDFDGQPRLIDKSIKQHFLLDKDSKVITEIRELLLLFSDYIIEEQQTRVVDSILSLDIMDGFTFLRPIITDYVKRGNTTLYAKDRDTIIIIGDTHYPIEYLNKIKNAEYYWDENNAKRRFGDCSYMNRIEEYEKYKDRICE